VSGRNSDLDPDRTKIDSGIPLPKHVSKYARILLGCVYRNRCLPFIPPIPMLPTLRAHASVHRPYPSTLTWGLEGDMEKSVPRLQGLPPEFIFPLCFPVHSVEDMCPSASTTNELKQNSKQQKSNGIQMTTARQCMDMHIRDGFHFHFMYVSCRGMCHGLVFECCFPPNLHYVGEPSRLKQAIAGLEANRNAGRLLLTKPDTN